MVPFKKPDIPAFPGPDRDNVPVRIKCSVLRHCDRLFFIRTRRTRAGHHSRFPKRLQFTHPLGMKTHGHLKDCFGIRVIADDKKPLN